MEHVGNLKLLLSQGPNGLEVSSSVEPLPQHRPRIGISGAGDDSKSVAAIMTQIRSTGAEPVYLGDHAARLERSGGAQAAAARDLAKLDGLIVMGNDADIDPRKYGEVAGAHTKVETNLARAAYEEAAIQKALDTGMPLLGVCGGMQRINVLGGGSLHQHVPDLVGDNHHMQSEAHIAPFVPVQAVAIADDSRLGEIGGITKSIYTPAHSNLPPDVVMENSFHHQAVKKVRDDFRINAVSSDGIIEGIEPKAGSRYADQYVMGVQWHPEFGASDLGPKIANSVTSAAKAYAKKKAESEEVTLNQAGRWQANADVPPPPQFTFLDPAAIKTDAATYQFRSGGDANGVTERFRMNEERWDPAKGAAPLIVHERLDGNYYCADGHHRLDLARRTNEMGTGPGKLPAIVLREADGYTPEDVKIMAAYKNMQRELGRGNSATVDIVDGAHAMKEARSLVDHPEWLPSLQMEKGDLHLTQSLSKLSDQSLGSVKQGRVPVQMAAAIAESTPDRVQQDKAIEFIGEKLAQNYSVSVRTDALPIATASFLTRGRSEVPPAPEPEPQVVNIPASYVAKLQQQRVAQAQTAMAR